MEIFMTEKFLSEFEAFTNEASVNNNWDSLENCIKIQKLLISGLKFSTNIEKNTLVQFYDTSGKKIYGNMKEIVSQSLIKSGNYHEVEINAQMPINGLAYYFLDTSCELPHYKGVVLVNDISKLQSFYKNCTINSFTITEDFKIIKKSIPPCSAMLIIDKYIFSSSGKIKNFANYLKLYIGEELEMPFHLTILSTYENKNKIIPVRYFEEAEEMLKKFNNLHFQILLNNKIDERDRLIFTNYTKGSFGHPFEEKPTVFNQNFLGTSNNILEAYHDFIQNLNYWYKFNLKIPNSIGTIKTKYANIEFTNRLFTDLSI